MYGVEKDEESVFPWRDAVVGGDVCMCVNPCVEEGMCECSCWCEMGVGEESVGFAVDRRQRDDWRRLRVFCWEVDVDDNWRRRRRNEPCLFVC